MRATLVFPPSLCLPNTLYFALPVLAGALKRAGHQARLLDLNLVAADRFLTPERTESLISRARRYGASLSTSVGPFAARTFARSLAAAEKTLVAAPTSKANLRDTATFFDAAGFHRDFWTIVDALGFVYQLDPVLSPHRPDFLSTLLKNQHDDPWTPLTELHEELVDDVIRGDPGLIGICIAFPEQSAEAIRLARHVRRLRPDVHICVGGPLVSTYANAWLGSGELFRWVDSFCMGDGEACIVELCDALEGRRPMESVTNLVRANRDGGVVMPRNGRVVTPMSEVPLPDFDSFDWSLEFLPKPLWPLMLARGCYWGRCTFCSIGWRENFQKAPNDNVRRDVVDLVRRLGARWIQVQDSSMPPAAALSLARIMKQERLEAYWVGGMKPDVCFLDESYCHELAAGGCRSLLMGIESVNQRVLDRMDKGYRVADLPRMLTNLRTAGISVEPLWFVGFPGETRTEALTTVRWLYENRSRYGLTAFVGEYLLHPDTAVYEDPKRFGLELHGTHNDTVHYTAREGMQPEELHRLEVMLSGMNNRTLTCSGSHMPHLAERGLEVRGIGRPASLPEPAVAFCTELMPESGAPPECFTRAGRQALFVSDFGFRQRLEAAFPAIRDEWAAVPPAQRGIWTEEGAADGYWGTIPLFAAGHRVAATCDLAPTTAAILATVPELYTAGFSVVGARSRLPRHCGEDRTLLRCHLAIKIPEGSRFDVDGLDVRWVEGKTVVFDDTLPHWVRNDSDEEKVILLVDFRTPPAIAGDRTPSPEQVARDRQYYSRLFPEWNAQAAQ